MTDTTIVDMIWTLLDARSPSASICPSDVARALAADETSWRALMPEVRRIAAALAADGLLDVTRGDLIVDAMAGGGPIRLRRAKGARTRIKLGHTL